jgi:hypothetical protein
MGARSDEAMKQYSDAIKLETLHRFNFFASVKHFIASLLQFFAVIDDLSLHRFPNLP